MVCNVLTNRQIQRALVALTIISPQSVTTAADALFQKAWAEGNAESVEKPAALEKTLNDAIGADLTKQVMEKITTDEVKSLLNTRTGEALDHGAFGVPWFVGTCSSLGPVSLAAATADIRHAVTNGEGKTESFWGFDHIGQMCVFLGLEKPQSSGGWQAML